MSTDMVSHSTRKAAGKIKIINCNNMQGCCPVSARPHQAAGKLEFRPLTLEVTTEAVGLWRFVVFVAARTYFKQQKKSKWERHRRVWDTLLSLWRHRREGDTECGRPGEDHRISRGTAGCVPPEIVTSATGGSAS